MLPYTFCFHKNKRFLFRRPLEGLYNVSQKSWTPVTFWCNFMQTTLVSVKPDILGIENL